MAKLDEKGPTDGWSVKNLANGDFSIYYNGNYAGPARRAEEVGREHESPEGNEATPEECEVNHEWYQQNISSEARYGSSLMDHPDIVREQLDKTQALHDLVDSGNHASYYDLPPDATRLQDLLVDMPWNQANIFKASFRWDKKPDLRYNLEKIIFFAEEELDRLDAEEDK